MFVCVLVVLASVNFTLKLFGRTAVLLRTPEEYCIGVVSSVCKGVLALEEYQTKVVSYVYDVLCPGVCATLVLRFLQIC